MFPQNLALLSIEFTIVGRSIAPTRSNVSRTIITYAENLLGVLQMAAVKFSLSTYNLQSAPQGLAPRRGPRRTAPRRPPRRAGVGGRSPQLPIY